MNNKGFFDAHFLAECRSQKDLVPRRPVAGRGSFGVKGRSAWASAPAPPRHFLIFLAEWAAK